MWGFSSESEVVAQWERWAGWPSPMAAVGWSWLRLTINSACSHEAWPLHFTTTVLHLLRCTRIWSAWLLFPSEFQAPAHFRWMDFQIPCVSVSVEFGYIHQKPNPRTWMEQAWFFSQQEVQRRAKQGGCGRWKMSCITLAPSSFLLCHRELVTYSHGCKMAGCSPGIRAAF